MSLLDILCGALGAFCFMMLVALPYYVVGKVDREKSRQRTEELLKDIDKLRERMSDPAQAEDLRKLVEELEAQIKQLQGELNQVTYENEELKKENARLQEELKELEKLREQVKQLLAENEQLRNDNAQVTRENQELKKKNEELTADRDRLHKENEQNKLDLSMKKPFVVMAGAMDQTQDLSVYVEDVVLDARTGDQVKLLNGKYDPHILTPTSNWEGDRTNFAVVGRGVTLWVSSTTMRNSVFRVYVSYRQAMQTPEQRRLPFSDNNMRPTGVYLTIFGNIDDKSRESTIQLTPDRYFTFAGTINIDAEAKMSFKPATETERDERWREIMKAELPTPTPAPTPAPTLSREEMDRIRKKSQEERRKMEEEFKRRDEERKRFQEERARQEGSPAPSASPAASISEDERVRQQIELRERRMRELHQQPSPSPAATP
jgi:hypothetical protein